MSDKSYDMNKTQVFTTGPKAVLIITPDGRLEAGEGLSHDEVSRELFKICSTYYGTRTAELERENAMLRRALADALSTFHHEDEVIVTAERVEAWKAALTNGGQP